MFFSQSFCAISFKSMQLGCLGAFAENSVFVNQIESSFLRLEVHKLLKIFHEGCKRELPRKIL